MIFFRAGVSDAMCPGHAEGPGAQGRSGGRHCSGVATSPGCARGAQDGEGRGAPHWPHDLIHLPCCLCRATSLLAARFPGRVRMRLCCEESWCRACGARRWRGLP